MFFFNVLHFLFLYTESINNSKEMNGAVYGVFSAGLTALWAIRCRTALFSNVLEAFALTGVFAFAVLITTGVKTPPFSFDQESLILFLILTSYQTSLYLAFKEGSSLMQAMVNLNVIFIVLHDYFWSPSKFYLPTLSAAAIIQVTASLFIVHQSGVENS